MGRIRKLANSGDLQELMNSFSVRDMRKMMTDNNRAQIQQQATQYWQGTNSLQDNQRQNNPSLKLQDNYWYRPNQVLQNQYQEFDNKQLIQKDSPHFDKCDKEQLETLHGIKDLLEKLIDELKDEKNKPECCPSNRFQPCPPRPSVSTKKYNNYYDVFHRIAIAGPVDPNDPDSPIYNREPIFPALNRNSEIINVANHGSNILFIRESHVGTSDFELETPIFPGTVRTFYNIFEIRLRSPRQGLAYSVSEYALASAFEVTPTPIEKADLSNTPLPPANSDWLLSDIFPTFPPSNFDMQVAVSISGILSAVIRNNGNVETVSLNAGSNPQTLLAGGLYRFNIMVHPGDAINLSYSTSGGIIQNLRIHELPG